MDLYSMERLILERHQQMVADAEQRAALSREVSVPVRALIAARLRSLADRIDHKPAASVSLKVIS